MTVDVVAQFIKDLRSCEDLAPFADGIECELRAADLAADGNAHVAAFFAGIEWIIAQPRTAREKLDVIAKMLSLKGQVHIPSLRAFAGWGS
jgi:hypothetical protein